MDNIIYLQKEGVYFYVGFLDSELTIPSIETWIYVGYDESHGHIFKGTDEEDELFCFPKGIHSNVLDHEALSGWLLEEHSPTIIAKEYVYESI